MAEYDNTNRGSIWKNERKEKDTHPDFTGSVNVEGKEYFVNAWKRKPGANERAPALSFTVVPKTGEKKPVNSAPSAPEVGDEEIPF